MIRPKTREREPLQEEEKDELRAQGQRGPDYDLVDVRNLEVVRGLEDTLQKRSADVKGMVAEHDPYAQDAEKILRVVKELSEADRIFWDNIDQALARDMRHPLWPYIARPRRERERSFLMRDIEGVASRFTLAKQKLAHTRGRIIETEKMIEEERRGAEVALASLKQKAEQTVRDLGSFFNLGLLPATRRRNTKRLEQARAALNHIHAFERGMEVPYLKRREFDPEDLAEIERIEKHLKHARDITNTLKSFTHTLQSDEASVESVWGTLRNSLTTVLTDVGSTEKGTTSRERFLAEAEVAREKMEQFENQLTEIFFRPLGITTEDEAKALAKPLPETAVPAVEKARERSFRNAREMVRGFIAYYAKQGKTMEQISADLAPHLERVRQTAFVSFNDKITEMLDVVGQGNILPKDLLPLDKREKSSTEKDSWARREETERMLGFVEGTSPVYLALGSSTDAERGAASGFGAFHLSFPLQFFEHRAVCTLGDSLNAFGVPYAFRNIFKHGEQGEARQLTLEHGLMMKALFDLDAQYEPKKGGAVNFISAVSYVEVQVPGPIDISGAQELVISPLDTMGEVEQLQKLFGNVEKMVERLSAALARLGEIGVRISSTKPVDLSHYYDRKIYERFYRQPTARAAA